jgi:hypothetical protein
VAEARVTTFGAVVVVHNTDAFNDGRLQERLGENGIEPKGDANVYSFLPKWLASEIGGRASGLLVHCSSGWA